MQSTQTFNEALEMLERIENDPSYKLRLRGTKLTDFEVNLIRSLCGAGMNRLRVCRALKISYYTASDVLSGRTNTHVQRVGILPSENINSPTLETSQAHNKKFFHLLLHKDGSSELLEVLGNDRREVAQGLDKTEAEEKLKKIHGDEWLLETYEVP